MTAKKIVCILGTTGVGKTKLSIQLAKLLNGEVINCDSMQVYKSLDIITNKPTLEEREGVEHHLFGFVDPIDDYNLPQFLLDCRNKIQDIYQRGKVPIIVGGTMYYIQSLFWNQTIHDTVKKEYPQTPFSDEIKLALSQTDPTLHHPQEIQTYCQTNSLHALLDKIDPEMAKRWHPQDTRRIRRSLEVYLETGEPHSKLIQDQKDTPQQIQYKTLFYWPYCPLDNLDPRLDARIDQMMDRGMMQELDYMWDLYNQGKTTGDYTRGVLQAIGFKEFDTYYKSNKDPTELSKAIQEMKTSTRQYARKQVRWIRNRMIPLLTKLHQQQASAFSILDVSKPETWNETVWPIAKQQALDFMNDLENTAMAPKHLEALLQEKSLEQEWDHFECKICFKKDGSPYVAHGTKQYEQHLNSKLHRSSLKRKEMGHIWEQYKQQRLKSKQEDEESNK
ncbi:tRNA isopentenyltransferase [Gorgonomyces haynaldii]|nr:tRNA isopentenyltransferase [Gorgonomyces haynaldii]